MAHQVSEAQLDALIQLGVAPPGSSSDSLYLSPYFTENYDLVFPVTLRQAVATHCFSDHYHYAHILRAEGRTTGVKLNIETRFTATGRPVKHTPSGSQREPTASTHNLFNLFPDRQVVFKSESGMESGTLVNFLHPILDHLDKHIPHADKAIFLAQWSAALVEHEKQSKMTASSLEASFTAQLLNRTLSMASRLFDFIRTHMDRLDSLPGMDTEKKSKLVTLLQHLRYALAPLIGSGNTDAAAMLIELIRLLAIEVKLYMPDDKMAQIPQMARQPYDMNLRLGLCIRKDDDNSYHNVDHRDPTCQQTLSLGLPGGFIIFRLGDTSDIIYASEFLPRFPSLGRSLLAILIGLPLHLTWIGGPEFPSSAIDRSRWQAVGTQTEGNPNDSASESVEESEQAARSGAHHEPLADQGHSRGVMELDDDSSTGSIGGDSRLNPLSSKDFLQKQLQNSLRIRFVTSPNIIKTLSLPPTILTQIDASLEEANDLRQTGLPTPPPSTSPPRPSRMLSNRGRGANYNVTATSVLAHEGTRLVLELQVGAIQSNSTRLSGDANAIGKAFIEHTAAHSDETLQAEALIYQRLAELQGDMIPACAGVWSGPGLQVLILENAGHGLDREYRSWSEIRYVDRVRIHSILVGLSEKAVIHADLELRHFRRDSKGVIRLIDFGDSQIVSSEERYEELELMRHWMGGWRLDGISGR